MLPLISLRGGLGIRNLATIKHSLMAKNLFNYLNKHDAIWVDILYMKYGEHNFWTHQNLTNVSVFFKGMCAIANIIKHNLWINCVNPNCTSVLYHP